jgi:hypothetical protein
MGTTGIAAPRFNARRLKQYAVETIEQARKTKMIGRMINWMGKDMVGSVVQGGAGRL